MQKQKVHSKLVQKRIQHQLTENVKLLQKAVLFHSGRVLILQRSDDAKTRPYCWDLPGGNSEWPENSVQNLENMHQADISREIKEETNITVVEEHFTRDSLVLLRTFFEVEKSVYSIILGWKVDLPSDFDENQVILSDEHIAQKWVAADELHEYDFGGKKGEFIKEIIRSSF